MDSFVAALKNGLGTNLEDLTTSGTGEPGQRSGAEFDPREKLPTHLSSDPSDFEKELRSLVLRVYSDQRGRQPVMSHPVEKEVPSRLDDFISGRVEEPPPRVDGAHEFPLERHDTGKRPSKHRMH